MGTKFFIDIQCPILLYERLRQRLRYFDPSLRDAPRTTGVTLSLSKGSGQASSVQVSTSAQSD